MTAAIVVGAHVQSTERIVEEDFNGEKLWVHAERGEVGYVMGVEEDWATVTWLRTGTTFDTLLTDLSPLSMPEEGRCQIPDLKA